MPVAFLQTAAALVWLVVSLGSELSVSAARLAGWWQAASNHLPEDDLYWAASNHLPEDDLCWAASNHSPEDDLYWAASNHLPEDDLYWAVSAGPVPAA
jgi:hypothetical protein